MSEATQDELKAELAAILEDTRRHLVWMADAGIRAVKRENAAAPAAFPAARPSEPARARPSFGEAPRPPPAAPVARPQPPPAQVPAVPRVSPPPMDAATALNVIREDLGECTRCGLAHGRTNIVFGQGSPTAEVLFLGEGPGEDEDLSGQAFVGRAGQLLTKMIEAMGYTRESVFICNVVKCRPPNNRRPEPAEIEACRPFFEKQIRAVKPKAIVALGATAAQALLKTDVSISRLRNNWHTWEGIPVMPTFHPSYLLRAPQEKGKAWDDLKLVMARLGKALPAKK